MIVKLNCLEEMAAEGTPSAVWGEKRGGGGTHHMPSQLAMLLIFWPDWDAAVQRPTRQPATHTPGCLEVHGTKKAWASPREWVMTSDAKHVVSQFWNLSEFHRLNSGGKQVLGTCAD